MCVRECVYVHKNEREREREREKKKKKFRKEMQLLETTKQGARRRKGRTYISDDLKP